MEFIASVEAGPSNPNEIEITNIPQDGTDLLIYVSTRGPGSTAGFRINNDSGTNYPMVQLLSNSTSIIQGGFTFSEFISTNNDSNATDNSLFSNNEFYIKDYTSSGQKRLHSSQVTENLGGVADMRWTSMTYTGTSPVTSIQILLFGANTFDAESEFFIYKITEA